MTKKEFVRQTMDKLMYQGGPGYERGIGCRYTMDDGKHCAIGIWIPEDKIKQIYETYTVEQVLSVIDHPAQHFNSLFINAVRVMHDASAVCLINHHDKKNWTKALLRQHAPVEVCNVMGWKYVGQCNNCDYD